MTSTRAASITAQIDKERDWEAVRATLHKGEGVYFDLQSTKP
jgi:hypothetical protein